MPPKKVANDANSEAAAFTETDIKFLKAFFEGMAPEAKNHINWEVVQKKLGHATTAATKKKFRLLSQAHKWCEYAEGYDNSKRAADDGDEAIVKKPKAKKQKLKVEDKNAEAGEE